MDLFQFRNFLRPNLSFKEEKASRGCKGVGATYLGYGFNHLEVATRKGGQTLTGQLVGGREWVDDASSTRPRPKVESRGVADPHFDRVSSGTSMYVRLDGADIRPKDLKWIGAGSADQWLAILRVVSPIGGIYLCGEAVPDVKVTVEVTGPDGIKTTTKLDAPCYLYPHDLFKRTVELREFLEDQARRADRGMGVSRLPHKYKNLTGIWGQWSIEENLT